MIAEQLKKYIEFAETQARWENPANARAAARQMATLAELLPPGFTMPDHRSLTLELYHHANAARLSRLSIKLFASEFTVESGPRYCKTNHAPTAAHAVTLFLQEYAQT